MKLIYKKKIFLTLLKNSYNLNFIRSISTINSSIQGKTAIITGSTSGIGLGIAKNLASVGVNILLNGFGEIKEIKKICQEISEKYKVHIDYYGADMRNPEEIHKMVEYASNNLNKGLGVDILVNNAGIQYISPVDQFPEDKWNQIIEINLNAVFHCTKAVLPFMKKKKWGRIINISSVHGLVGSIEKSAYVAAKHGVVGFSKVVALETAGTGITCNCINPGWVHTDLVDKQIKARQQRMGGNSSYEDAARDLLSEKQPSKQFVTVDQIGSAVIFLCSPYAEQITGISLPIDGGWTAQ
jgi:3-hydroxybutyrate dehydrogenase